MRWPRLCLEITLLCLLFGLCDRVYRRSTGHIQNCDSVYSLVIGEKILRTGSSNLFDCLSKDRSFRSGMPGYNPENDLPYQLVRYRDVRALDSVEGVYYGYPLGSTILSLPFIEYYAIARGQSMLKANGEIDSSLENDLQLKIAAKVSAAIVCLFYILARQFLSIVPSLLIAIGFAFGSPLWSTLSRALWSHTWMTFFLTCSVILMLRCRERLSRTLVSDLTLGLALGVTMFAALTVRAHAIISITAILLYLALGFRRIFLIALFVIGIMSCSFVAFCFNVFGSPSPPSVYDAGAIDGRDVFNRFFWLMCSPSRGVLLYCPYLVLALVMLAINRGESRSPTSDSTAPNCLPRWSLAIPIILAISAHSVLFSCYNGWHAGSSYGPRYFSDLLPWFVIVMSLAVRNWITLARDRRSAKNYLITTLLAISFAWAIFVHGRGANSVRAWIWNARSLAVGQEEAVKEWDHPQFLAGLWFEVALDGSIQEVKKAPPVVR